MRSARAVACGLLALAASGCLLTDDSPPEVVQYWAARHRWEANRPAAYTVTEHVGCFCPCPPPFTVIVEGDEVVGVADVEPWPGSPEDPVPGALLCARSVDAIFALIREQVGSADSFRADYDPELGYPTFVSIDPDRRAVDEEISFRLWDLTPQDPED